MVNQGLTTPEIDSLQLNDLKLKEGEIFISGSRRSNERTLELKSSNGIPVHDKNRTIKISRMQNQPFVFVNANSRAAKSQ